MKQPRVRWTDEERQAIFERLIEVYAEGKRSDPSSILQLAQRVLPIERRRRIYPSMVYKLRPWMDSARVESYTRARNRKLTEVALTNKVTIADIPSVSVPTELGVQELVEKLIDQLANRITTEVMRRVSEQLSVLQKPYQPSQPVAEVNPVQVATPQPPKVRRKRVTIIGLKGQQITTVEQKYPDIDFTFMTTEEAQGRNPGEGDWTIVMTKFVNHGTYAKYRHAANLKHCNGGVSDLSTIIQTIRNS